MIIEADKNSATFVVLQKSKQQKLSLCFARNASWLLAFLVSKVSK